MSTEYAQRAFIAHNRREAVIIAPFQDRDTGLEQLLAEAFGGFTRTSGVGAWRNPDTQKTKTEGVHVYTIAMLDIADNHHKLLTIASQFRTEAKQHTVYMRLPNGRVVMLDHDYNKED